MTNYFYKTKKLDKGFGLKIIKMEDVGSKVIKEIVFPTRQKALYHGKKEMRLLRGL